MLKVGRVPGALDISLKDKLVISLIVFVTNKLPNKFRGACCDLGIAIMLQWVWSVSGAMHRELGLMLT